MTPDPRFVNSSLILPNANLIECVRQHPNLKKDVDGSILQNYEMDCRKQNIDEPILRGYKVYIYIYRYTTFNNWCGFCISIGNTNGWGSEWSVGEGATGWVDGYADSIFILKQVLLECLVKMNIVEINRIDNQQSLADSYFLTRWICDWQLWYR